MTKEEEEAIEKIDKKLDTTEDEEIIVNLLYKKIDLLEDTLKEKDEESHFIQSKLDEANASIVEKDKEIEKYKYLYQKALDNTIKADRENIQLKKQTDLMAERLRFDEELKFEVCKDCEPLKEELCGEPTKTQYQPTELKCVKQYFERKVRDERN